MEELCFVGSVLRAQLNGVCVDADGECTDLYYHLQECDVCEELRNNKLEVR